jgi:hypothetical protein
MATDPGENVQRIEFTRGNAEVTSAETPAMVHRTKIHGKDVDVEFPDHANDRMKERKVTVNEVLACLRSPDQRGLPTDRPDRQRVRRRDASSPSRALDVIFEEPAPGRIRVVTVIRLRA